MSENQLVVIDDKNALDLFTSVNGLDPVLQGVRKIIDEFKPDTSTKKGRDAIASLAYSVAQSKTYLDGVGKQLTDKLKEQPKLVDAERKRVRDMLDAWKDEVRKPLTLLEDAEKKVIDDLQELQETAGFTSENIRMNIDIASGIDVSFAVIKPKELAEKKEYTLFILDKKLKEQLTAEHQAAEIERLRKEAAEREKKEREERIAREAAEQARRQAELEAQRQREEEQRKINEEKLAAERREMQLKLDAENAERRRLEAEQMAERERQQATQRAEHEKQQALLRERQAAENERLRIEREQAAAKAEADRQAANKAHRAAVNREILAALVAAGFSDDQGKAVITMAAKGEAGRLTINY